mmetsp:Transcript_41214/g.66839  ORF Transcript_41214/g.66839 Transcript_41214/m.66839 type:complete len:705 (+) Transcript_41214:47-2161(+)|eukprot:CAMPEP_0184350294 /NCGR_PEP_ID=MMETSP1089-20130417/37618_1 /TAXON_ID=38269 ORGANISM="Gloeochaete wittrockiana, Strain SAG46.84" /NCGR_SAMPLE_ID=MMETSP1089 /ASSEMBLY_ACC=CAM_ASM_000445 /LENGTH=704 /DNA_ID=CAMNT_0026682957 /DNA_START=47 /DNA_END=2161 /DNA_ORIENTATION=-
MRARDLGILFLSALAIFVSFQQDSGDVALKKTWQHSIDPSLWENQQFPTATEALPPPIITDLDGDGDNEVIAVTTDCKILVLEASQLVDWVPTTSKGKEQLNSFTVKAEQSLLPKVGINIGRKPVALATGYIDTYNEKQARQQVIVVVTREWTVLCYDYKLKLMWEHSVQEHFPTHDIHREVAVLVTAFTVKKGDRGLVIVAGSTDLDNEAREKLKKQQKEEFEEDEHEPEWRFSYYAFEGGKGSQRWKHEASAFQKLQEDSKVLYPQHAHKLDSHSPSKLKHSLDVDWRQYRNQLLSVLPHHWEARWDTHLTLAHFGGRNRPVKKGTAAAVAAKGSEKTAAGSTAAKATADAAAKAPNLLKPKLRLRRRMGHKRPHSAQEHMHHADVVAVHFSRGIEVIHLFSGRTVCQLPLGEGSHADINLDGVIEHVSAIGGTKPMSSDSEVGESFRSLWCHGLALTGIPPRDALWNGTICGTAGINLAAIRSSAHRAKANRGSDIFGGMDPYSDFVEVVSPLFMKTHRVKAAGIVDQTLDSIFYVSNGRISSYSSNGVLNWQTPPLVPWPTYMRRVSDPDNMHVEPAPALRRLPVSSHLKEEYVIAVGYTSLVVIEPLSGKVLNIVQLPEVPTGPIVIGDFNNDGLNDVLVPTRLAYYGLTLKKTPGSRILALFVGAFLIAISAVFGYNYLLEKPGGRGAPSKSLKRSTD